MLPYNPLSHQGARPFLLKNPLPDPFFFDYPLEIMHSSSIDKHPLRTWSFFAKVMIQERLAVRPFTPSGCKRHGDSPKTSLLCFPPQLPHAKEGSGEYSEFLLNVNVSSQSSVSSKGVQLLWPFILLWRRNPQCVEHSRFSIPLYGYWQDSWDTKVTPDEEESNEGKSSSSLRQQTRVQ